MKTSQSNLSNAEICRRMGWQAGTLLIAEWSAKEVIDRARGQCSICPADADLDEILKNAKANFPRVLITCVGRRAILVENTRLPEPAEFELDLHLRDWRAEQPVPFPPPPLTPEPEVFRMMNDACKRRRGHRSRVQLKRIHEESDRQRPLRRGLILTRKVGQSVVAQLPHGGELVVTPVFVRGGRVRLRFAAARELPIYREELLPVKRIA